MSTTVTKRRYKLQQTKCIPEILIDMDNLMDVDEDEETDESGAELDDNDPYINYSESDDNDPYINYSESDDDDDN